MAYISKLKKQQLKDKAITDLFNSGIIQAKIKGICIRHNISLDTDIPNDILMVTFENICKYDLNKFYEMISDKKNPNRLIGLATTIAVQKGVFKHKTKSKYWIHSIAQQILHASTFNTQYHINPTENDEDFNIQVESEIEIDETEMDNENMWEYVRLKLSVDEIEILDTLLLPESQQPKLKGEFKKQYKALLPKIKIIITEYNQMN